MSLALRRTACVAARFASFVAVVTLALLVFGVAHVDAQATLPPTPSASPTQPPSASPASDEAARILFAAGAEAYDAGRYEEALGNFQRAFELSGRSVLHFNIALALDRLRRDEDALASYRRFLAEAPATAPHRAEVESRVAVLERTVADRRELEARANASLREDGASPRRRPLVRQWWLWTAIGAVAVTAVVVPIVVTRDRTEASTPSDFGGPVVVRFGGGS